MRQGRAETVRRGPYNGDRLSADHIIPRAVCPELDNGIANLELMPLRMNESKNAKVGDRQLSLAKTFRAASLLSIGLYGNSSSSKLFEDGKVQTIDRDILKEKIRVGALK